MKTKVISKIIAIALTAVMTTCLTACEDERNIPAYGTGLESEADTVVRHNLSPTAPVETEPAPVLNADAYIKYADIGYDEEMGEYVFVYVVITNNMDKKMEAWRLAQTKVFADNGLSLKGITKNLMGDDHEDVATEIKPGKQAFIIQKFRLSSMGSIPEFIDIRVNVWDNTSQDYMEVDYARLYLTE